MIKAIFFDIDGTLVSFKAHRISPAVLDGLYRLREKGIKLFIATGRQREAAEGAVGGIQGERGAVGGRQQFGGEGVSGHQGHGIEPLHDGAGVFGA